MNPASMPHARGWRWFEYVLWAALTLTAALNMAHVHGGFLTNHLADVSVPALLYVITSGASGRPRPRFIPATLGRSPALLAFLIFAASTATEVSQHYWPHGWFPGTFDPMDIVAFAVGVFPCFLLHRLQSARPARTAEGGP